MPGSIGPLEILIVLVIALVVFGPRRLPELSRNLGKGLREFKDSVSGESKDVRDDDVKAIGASPRQAEPVSGSTVERTTAP